MVLVKKVFFDGIRDHFFPHGMSQGQVDGIDAILDCWNSGPPGLFEGAVYDAHLAYMLATVYHETAQQMSPVKEGLSASDHWRQTHLRYYPWYGRGMVQLTWKANYQKMAEGIKHYIPKAAGLASDPDLALDLDISTAILFYGMSRGSFTGHSLHTYIHDKTTDFDHCRKIINGMDRYQLIAGYARHFLPAVKAATAAAVGDGPSPVHAAPDPKPATDHKTETIMITPELGAMLEHHGYPGKPIERILADALKAG